MGVPATRRRGQFTGGGGEVTCGTINSQFSVPVLSLGEDSEQILWNLFGNVGKLQNSVNRIIAVGKKLRG